MSSPTWGRGKVHFHPRLCLEPVGASLGLGWVQAGPLENSWALGTLRRVWEEGYPCPAGRASLSLEPGTAAPEGAGGRQRLEPRGGAGCPASSPGPC